MPPFCKGTGRVIETVGTRERRGTGVYLRELSDGTAIGAAGLLRPRGIFGGRPHVRKVPFMVDDARYSGDGPAIGTMRWSKYGVPSGLP